jgi:hypothetical protein
MRRELRIQCDTFLAVAQSVEKEKIRRASNEDVDSVRRPTIPDYWQSASALSRARSAQSLIACESEIAPIAQDACKLASSFDFPDTKNASEPPPSLVFASPKRLARAEG